MTEFMVIGDGIFYLSPVSSVITKHFLKSLQGSI